MNSQSATTLIHSVSYQMASLLALTYFSHPNKDVNTCFFQIEVDQPKTNLSCVTQLPSYLLTVVQDSVE